MVCWWLRGCWGADGHCGGDLSFLVGCWGFCPHLQCYKPDHKGRGLVLGKSRGDVLYWYRGIMTSGCQGRGAGQQRGSQGRCCVLSLITEDVSKL